MGEKTIIFLEQTRFRSVEYHVNDELTLGVADAQELVDAGHAKIKESKKQEAK